MAPSDQHPTDDVNPDAAADAVADGEATRDEAAYVAAYDLDGDGSTSASEDAKGFLGLVDAELEDAADDGGIKGRIAGAMHRVVDRFDND